MLPTGSSKSSLMPTDPNEIKHPNQWFWWHTLPPYFWSDFIGSLIIPSSNKEGYVKSLCENYSKCCFLSWVTQLSVKTMTLDILQLLHLLFLTADWILSISFTSSQRWILLFRNSILSRDSCNIVPICSALLLLISYSSEALNPLAIEINSSISVKSEWSSNQYCTEAISFRSQLTLDSLSSEYCSRVRWTWPVNPILPRSGNFAPVGFL